MSRTAEMLKRFVGLYTKEAPASVLRNRHMNDLKGDEDVSEVVAAGVAETIVADALPECAGMSMAIPILKTLADAARSRYHDADPVQQALAVDFVNFCGMRWCCDYAMYTSDLKKFGYPERRPQVMDALKRARLREQCRNAAATAVATVDRQVIPQEVAAGMGRFIEPDVIDAIKALASAIEKLCDVSEAQEPRE